MKYFKIALFFILAYLIQITLLSRFPFFGVRPDLLLVCVTMISVRYGAVEGFLGGLICGVTQDVFGGIYYIQTISKSMLGFLVGTYKESVLGTEEAVNMTAVFAATVTNFVFEVALMYFFFGKPIAPILFVLISLILSCFYNGVIAYLAYPVIKRLAVLVFEE